MNANLDQLRTEERRLWALLETAQEAMEKARDIWCIAKEELREAELKALIEARVQDRLAAERRGQIREQADIDSRQ